MTCREFEERWNDVLDARSEGLPEIERALEAHASTCEPCQAISARYQLLRQTVAAWGPPPVPSAGSIERLRNLSVTRKPLRVVGRWVRFGIPLATAAAILALVWIGDLWRPGQPKPDGALVQTSERVSALRPIGSALEQATSATIDLALEASAPAARIGRDVFSPEEEAIDPAEIRLPEAEVAVVEDPVSATDLLQTVGQRVNAGVKPISGSARHAFSFLLGPPPGTDRHASDPADVTR
jgi:hypothetical protein